MRMRDIANAWHGVKDLPSFSAAFKAGDRDTYVKAKKANKGKPPSSRTIGKILKASGGKKKVKDGAKMDGSDLVIKISGALSKSLSVITDAATMFKTWRNKFTPQQIKIIDDEFTKYFSVVQDAVALVHEARKPRRAA